MDWIGHPDRQRLGILKHRHAVQLAACQQKRADAIHLGGIVCERFRVGADGLNMGQFALGVHAISKGSPRSANRRLEFCAIEQTLIHAPSQRVGVKTRAARLLEGITLRVEQARMPQTIGLLGRQNRLGHFLEQLLETRATRMVCRQQLQHADEPGHDPSVAAAPENFLAVGLAPVEVGAVAEVEMFARIVKIVRRTPPILHCKIEIALVARGGEDLHPHGRGHEQRIAPGPQLGNLVVRLMEIQALNFRRRGEDSVEPRPQGRNHFRIAVKEIETCVCLADRQIVGMIHAWSGLPAVGFAHREQRVTVFRVTGDAGQRHHPCVSGGLRPIGCGVRGRMRELPIRHALHD